MKNFSRIISVYFFDFLFLEIPNLIQIVTFVLVLSLFFPDKYLIWIVTTLVLFSLYLFSKIIKFPKDFFDQDYFHSNFRRFFIVFYSFSAVLIISMLFGLIWVTKIIAVENKLQEIERSILFKSTDVEEVESFLKNN
jgi:hypothetical protein